MRSLASWAAALALLAGLTSAQLAEAGDYRARSQLNPATSGAGFGPADYDFLELLLYLEWMEAERNEEASLPLSWGGGWDWDEDIVPGSWEWEEDLVDNQNPHDSPGP